MKKEIKCPRCRRRIQKEDAYCQYCGCHVAEEKKKKRKNDSGFGSGVIFYAKQLIYQ